MKDFLGIALLVLAGSLLPRPAQAVDLKSCLLPGPLKLNHVKAQCGTLAVPENPAEPDGRQIELFFAVVPADSPEPAPDPVVLLAGGPGQAATEAFVPIWSAFGEINDKRDILLLDQRGTGRSHPLDCAFEPEDLWQSEFNAATIQADTRRCQEALKDTDPRFYTTPIAMDDLDRVREALGYKKLNLVGVSYGTRATQVYLRRHPEHVRSVVLAGVVPMQAALGMDHARHLDRALKALFERCAQTPACDDAFPQPWAGLQDLLDQLEVSPASVSLTHPRTAERMTIPFSRMGLASAVRLLAYTPETQALLPLLILDAEVNDNFSRLAAQALMVSESLIGQLSRGMEMSVMCAEDVPFYPPTEAALADSVLGGLIVQSARWACQVWPQGDIPADYHQPVETDKPVLLLSGEFDPVTPPAYAQAAMTDMENARHLVVPGQGHALLGRGCVPKVLAAFITQPGFESLDTECLERMGPFPFFIDFTGPAP